MPVAKSNAPAYNVQTAVDAQHALIVAHAITLDAGDNRCLEPMAEAVRKALAPHVPATRGGNNRGDGTCSTTLKYRIFGHPRFLLRGLRGAQTEIGLAIMAYNLKRMIDVLVAVALNRKLNPA